MKYICTKHTENKQFNGRTSGNEHEQNDHRTSWAHDDENLMET